MCASCAESTPTGFPATVGTRDSLATLVLQWCFAYYTATLLSTTAKRINSAPRRTEGEKKKRSRGNKANRGRAIYLRPPQFSAKLRAPSPVPAARPAPLSPPFFVHVSLLKFADKAACAALRGRCLFLSREEKKGEIAPFLASPGDEFCPSQLSWNSANPLPVTLDSSTPLIYVSRASVSCSILIPIRRSPYLRFPLPRPPRSLDPGPASELLENNKLPLRTPRRGERGVFMTNASDSVLIQSWELNIPAIYRGI